MIIRLRVCLMIMSWRTSFRRLRIRFRNCKWKMTIWRRIFLSILRIFRLISRIRSQIIRIRCSLYTMRMISWRWLWILYRSLWRSMRIMRRSSWIRFRNWRRRSLKTIRISRRRTVSTNNSIWKRFLLSFWLLFRRMMLRILSSSWRFWLTWWSAQKKRNPICSPLSRARTAKRKRQGGSDWRTQKAKLNKIIK